MFRRRLMMNKTKSDIVVSDSFNRADGPIGIADTGQQWLTTRLFIISNNTAKGTEASDSIATIDSGITDIDMTVKTNLVDMVGVTFGYADTTLHYRVFMVYSIGSVVIRKGPYATPLQSVTLPLERKVYKVRVVSINGLIRVYLDDVLIIEVSDSSYRSSRQGIISARVWDTFDDYIVKRATPFAENVVFEASSLSLLNKTGDNNILSCFPIVYGGVYKITFDFSVKVVTPYTGNMLIAIRNVSAFDYVLLRSIDGTVAGTYTGSVSYTATALKNAGDTLTIMLRAYTGVGDCTLSNVKIEKVG